MRLMVVGRSRATPSTTSPGWLLVPVRLWSASAADQLAWLGDVGFDADVVWSHRDLAVIHARA